MGYVVGIKNDKESSNKPNSIKKRIEKWKMSQYFMTSKEIQRKYGIDFGDLPSGSNSKLKLNVDNQRLIYAKNTVSIQNYIDLKPIKTKLTNKSRTFSISPQKLYEMVQKSTTFRPIISFSEDKHKYYIDMILMVDIGKNDWIGIIFRDYNGDNNFHPIDLAIDCYDIRNKMMLFQPPNNDREYDDMHQYQNNNISGLNIIEYGDVDINPEQERIADLERRLFSANQIIQSLENKVKEQQIKIQKQSM